MAEPLVTIGLPVFNGENFLDRALDSLRRQTLTDVEILVSDNGSTDRTGAIAQRHARRDERVRYVHHPMNRGASFNANFVIAEARGRYFKLASHDDEAAPGMIEACVAVLERDPGVVLCYPKTALIDESSALVGIFENRMHLTSEDPCRRLHRILRVMDRCNAVFGVTRTATFRQTRLFPAYISSDRVALAELALRGRFHELDEPLFLRRMHPGISTVANPNPSLLLAWFDPEARGWLKRRYPGSWLELEYARAILRAPLTIGQKRRCLAILYRVNRLRFRGQGTPTGAPVYQKTVGASRLGERNRCIAALRAAMGERRSKDAARLAARLAALDPLNPTALTLQAIVSLSAGDVRGALSLAAAAAVRGPDRCAVLVVLGVAEAVSGRSDAARRTFERALRLAPDSASARHNRAVLDQTASPRLADLRLLMPMD